MGLLNILMITIYDTVE